MSRRRTFSKTSVEVDEDRGSGRMAKRLRMGMCEGVDNFVEVIQACKGNFKFSI